MSYYKVNKIKKRKLKSISKILFLSLSLIVLHACAKHNAGVVKQTYHDLTSHYNGYFNGNENYNIQLKSLSKDRKEDYNQILPLYEFGSIDEIQSKNSNLDISIQKARLSIQTHQEKKSSKNYKKGEDNSISNWADDAFLLIGKSYYMQGKMDSAISCFKYITANFEDGVDARSKKKIKKQKSNKKLKAKIKKQEKKLLAKEVEGKDIRPSKKLLVHEATRSEALIWLANAYTNKKMFTEAEAILTYASADKNFYKDYDDDLNKAYTYLFLSQNNFSNSIQHLQKTIAATKKNRNKARAHFILGQLYEEQGNNQAAAENYKQSIKGNSNFEMVFYAKLKQIQMNRKAEENITETNKLIKKLLKDNKNRDYYDQLYFEKAMLALNDGDREDAKKFLTKSIEQSTVNSEQKGISYIKLADLFYEEEAYVLAQANYDSSIALIDENYPDFEKVNNRTVVLTDLVNYLNTITLNDSLLVLANLSPKQLESMLYKKAVDLVDAEIKTEEKNKQAQLMPTVSTTGKNSKNAWYFYSEASKNSGYKKFKQKWGDIELADDWRRSDKSSGGDFDDEETEFDEEDEYFNRVDEKYQAMLNAIPNSDEAKNELSASIIEAYYNAAVTYKIGLDNLPKSIEMFEKLNKKYPSNIYKPEALYQLYVIYSDLNKPSKADEVKIELITKYPNNEYAAYLKDPRKLKQKSNKEEVENYYELTYQKYKNEKYDEVILSCSEIDNKFEENHIKAKFDLLKAMAIGGKKLKEPFIASLEYVVKTHQNTEEQVKASQLLAYLNNEVDTQQNNSTEKNIQEEVEIKTNDSNAPTLNEEEDSKKKKNGLKLKLGKKEINIGGNNTKDATDPIIEEENK